MVYHPRRIAPLLVPSLSGLRRIQIQGRRLDIVDDRTHDDMARAWPAIEQVKFAVDTSPDNQQHGPPDVHCGKDIRRCKVYRTPLAPEKVFRTPKRDTLKRIV